MSSDVDRTVVVFDADDYAADLDGYRIEIKAQLRNGAFQHVAVIDSGIVPPGIFHGVFKVCISGHLSHSNVDPVP